MSKEGARGAHGPQHYERIVEGALDFGILSFDPEANILTWNAGAERLFGYAREEVMGQTGAFIFTPEDQAAGEYDRELTTAAREGRAEDDRWHTRKDGSRFWASGVLFALRGPDGQIQGFVKVVRDKSDERRVQESLRASEEQFARLFLGNPAPVVVEDREMGTLVIANEAFFEFSGFWRSESLGHSGKELGLWAEADQRAATLRALESGTVRGHRLDVRTKAGKVVGCTSAVATTELNGRPCFVITLLPLTTEV